MKKIVLISALIGASVAVSAQNKKVQDTLQHVKLHEVEIIANRATAKTPIAYTNIKKEELQQQNIGKDVPFLLQSMPSIVATSDAGAGIGYTAIRVRGTDPTRINITANGIPLNDSESHVVYWVNMPDLTSSVDEIQVQRGVGTSTNGAGAFGANINMKTTSLRAKPYATLNFSAGSFGTHKENITVGTGLINNHWAFDARLSNIGTDGYIERSGTKLNSYYLQGGYYNDNTSIRLITFAGKERTHLAWDYATPEERAIFGKRFNPAGYMFVTDKEGKVENLNITEDKKQMLKAKELESQGGKIHFYDNQTDNYIQKHYQLLIYHTFADRWHLNAALHYTKGDGFYQEYKRGRKLLEYGLTPFEYDGKMQKKSDIIRKKELDNWFGGEVASITYKGEKLNLSLGEAFNKYDGAHFGKVLWVKNYIGNINPNNDYYRNHSVKYDGNIYLKAEYQILPQLNLYGDLQYRHISYKIEGPNDKWDKKRNNYQQLNINEKFNFFNPKAGVFYSINRNNNTYFSVAVAHKEPTRDNYKDGRMGKKPQAERLIDYELGYNFQNSIYHFGANFYYMDYKDQLIPTGEQNEVGEAISANVPKSYRMGVELSSDLQLRNGFSWNINATFSHNRIKDYVETIYGYDNDGNSLAPLKVNHGETHIAFSPEIIFNNIFGYEYKGLHLSLQTQYVGKQYMSNMDLKEHELKAYCVSNLNASYRFHIKGMKFMEIGATVYNIFNADYINNGYASRSFTNDLNHITNYLGYAQQAGANFLAHCTLSF